MKLTKIYTRTGDSGQTSLVGGIRISKDSSRIEAYGTIDELSSHLGLLASYITTDTATDDAVAVQIHTYLEHIQCCLFNIGTYLATDTTQTPIYPSAQLQASEIPDMEKRIDDINTTLPPLTSFILPGGSLPASQCHVCRTVCRRAERRMLTLIDSLPASANFNSDILTYINRLSDYLFVLARKLNFLYSTDEKTWQNSCK